MIPPFEIIDISQPVDSQSACFPGDTAFHREITIDYAKSGVINLCAFTMSPHVGTHADAPVHIHGDLNQPAPNTEKIGQVSLNPFVGSVVVVDVSPCVEAITWRQVESQLAAYADFPERILFKTCREIRYDVFEKNYAWLSMELVEKLAERNVKLVGLDTPSVDAVDSKTLEAHHALLKGNIAWLENLDLTDVPINPERQETYFLSALPLKFTELEASPLRAVLLRFLT